MEESIYVCMCICVIRAGLDPFCFASLCLLREWEGRWLRWRVEWRVEWG